MTTNRVRLVGGAILTGALLLGTVGLALAQDPTASSGPRGAGTGGSGMTRGQGMTGRSSMMDSLTMVGSINGAMGTMHASMTADQLEAMGTMHASMTTRGVDEARGR